MRKDNARLEDINNAAIRVAEYVAGIPLEQFLEDNMRKAATIREIEVMGEAAYRVSNKFKTSHLDVPWAVLTNLRNFYIHVYDRSTTRESGTQPRTPCQEFNGPFQSKYRLRTPKSNIISA